MPIILDVFARVFFAGVVACITYYKFPEITVPGILTVFQISMLFTICTVNPRWEKLLSIASIRAKQGLMEVELKKVVFLPRGKRRWPEIKAAGDGLELANAILETSARKYVFCKSAEDFLVKKSQQMQEQLNKQFGLTLIAGAAVVVGTIVFNAPPPSPATYDASKNIYALFAQTLVGGISLVLTVGFLYGEIDFARALVRSA